MIEREKFYIGFSQTMSVITLLISIYLLISNTNRSNARTLLLILWIGLYIVDNFKTLKGYLPYIKNSLSNPYHNGFVEGNNNFIKVLKRIAFGFRSFHRFKARIMICKNLLHVKRVNAI